MDLINLMRFVTQVEPMDFMDLVDFIDHVDLMDFAFLVENSAS